MVDPSLNFDAQIDRVNKKLELFQKLEVVENNDERLLGNSLDQYNNLINPENFICIDEAKKIDSDLEVGDSVDYDLEFENMGRNAATILHNNFEYKIQRFIEENLVTKFKNKIGKIVNGSVTRVDRAENTFIEIGEVKAILPRKNRIKGEIFKVGDHLKAVVKAVKIDKSLGLIIEISRTSPKFLEALIALEVPEVKDNRITIEASARIPGSRAKIALSTIEPNIDPIGSVVGVKGVRISSISQELNGESIDCVEYSTVPEMFLSRALSPAIISSVVIDKSAIPGKNSKAVVTIPSDQKSKAIGRVGLNIRLASMLTKTDIELKEIEATNALSGFANDQQNDNKSAAPVDLEALFK
jgi:N utilization substance protein A